MPRYTPAKIDNALKSLDDALLLQKKVSVLYGQLSMSLNRIKFAMIEDFDKVIKTKLAEAEKIELEILNKEDPNSWKYRNHANMAKTRAKIRLTKEFSSILQNQGLRENWNTYMWRLKEQWSTDRKKFLESGEIE